MIPRRLAVAATLCVLAASEAWAQQAAQKPLQAPEAIRQGAAAIADKPAQQPSQPSGQLQGQLQGQNPGQQPAQAPLEWSPQEIALAQARCAVLLKGLDVVVAPAAPWREGECGAAAPRQLVAIGKSPQVALHPPVALTCDMIASLYKWVQRDLQPLARKHLGAPLARIDSMSAYSCRNAYGRAKSRLSEHGRANALDIGAFVTAKAQATSVLADWGMTAREIAAQAAAAAKTEAAAAQLKAAPAGGKDNPSAASSAQQGPRSVAAGATQIGIPVGIPGISLQLPGGLPGEMGQIGLTPPHRLGGPKSEADAGSNAAALNGRMDFLRAAHRAACKTFGTVLGPEANKAHRNHFHVDMADRNGIMICE